MTKDELIRIAIECQLVTTGNRDGLYMEALEKFASLICAKAKAEEREACIKVCEPKNPRPCDCDYCYCGNSGDKAAVVYWDLSNELASAIKSRGQV